MVSRAKEAFGRRLHTLLDLSDMTDWQLAGYLKRTVKQVDNYLDGHQGPTFEGLAEMRILFGVRSGELDGSEPLQTPIDKVAVKARLKKMT